MKRRDFITLLGAMAASPLAARAQQPGKVPRVGFLYPGSVAASTSRIAVVMAGLRSAGERNAKQVELV